jgi:uncharacterized repeat protein (TIGR01451 family)
MAFTPSAWSGERCEGLVIRQVAPATIKEGDKFTYAIRIQQAGPCDLKDLEITDYLPQGAVWLEGNPRPEELPLREGDPNDPLPVSKARWKGRVLQQGQGLELGVTLQLGEQRPGWIRNTVCVTAPSITRKCDVIETFVRRE